MEAIANENFLKLLEEISTETFPLQLTDGNVYNFKQLTTAHLKDLIETVVDSPLMQPRFNLTCSSIMEQSASFSTKEFNVVDRLLFVLETRIQSISPFVTIQRNNKNIQINLADIKTKLREQIAENYDKFKQLVCEQGDIKLICQVPSIKTDDQLNEEIYKNADLNLQDIDQLRKVIGETFVNEIAKSISSITIKDQTIDLSNQTFASRLQIVKSLPASAISKVVGYIESYKQIIDRCLVVEETPLLIDGSLFSIR